VRKSYVSRPEYWFWSSALDRHVAAPCLNRTLRQITVPDHGRFIIVGF
jgi:hypothetical protein